MVIVKDKEMIKPKKSSTSDVPLKLFCEKIQDNKDGSIIVQWGYQNFTTEEIDYIEGETYIVIEKGSAILKPMKLPRVFVPGIHRQCFQTISTEDSHIQWQVGKQTLSFKMN